MLFDDCPLNDMVGEIVRNSTIPPTITYDIVIFYGEGDKDYIVPLRVVNEDLLSDFTRDFADGRVISVIMTSGKYAYKILPNQKTLRVELTRYTDPPINKIGGESTNGYTQKFKAVLLNKDDPIAANNLTDVANEFKLDIFDVTLVKMQIIDEFTEQLRTIKIGTVYRDCTVGDVIKTSIHNYTKKIKSKTPFNGVEIYGVTREKKDKQIPIVDNTRLVDVPKYLQKNSRGVFSAGLSSFYRNGWWYIWPTFDTTRFNEAEHKVTIVNVPAIRYSGVHSTFSYEGNHLLILATGETAATTEHEASQLNVGNAGRIGSAETLHEGTAVKYEKNKAKYNADKIISEYSVDERPDEAAYTDSPGKIKITDNLLNEISKRAMALGDQVYTVWENSFDEAILPGMPCRYLNWDGKRVVEKDGIILATHTFTQPSGANIIRGKYVSVTGLLLFLARDIKDTN